MPALIPLHPVPALMAACAVAAAACYLVPSPASARSVRAVLASVLLIGFAWLAVGYLVGPRGEVWVSITMVMAAALATIAAWKATDRQVRIWLSALGLVTLLIGAPDLLLSTAALERIDRAGGSVLVGAAGCAILIAGQGRDRRAMAVVVAAAWIAWLIPLARTQDSGWSLLCFLAAVGAGSLLAAWIWREATFAIMGALAGELALVLAFSSGRGPWASTPAPLEAYTIGSLAIALLLVGMLLRAERLSWTAARRAVAALAVAVGVASLSGLAWSLTRGSTAQITAVSWLGLAGLLGWLVNPASPYGGSPQCYYCGYRDQPGDRADRISRYGPTADPACLGVCRDAGRQRAGAHRLLRPVRRRN